LAFLIIVPIFFGDVFHVTDSMVLAFGGAKFNLFFNVYIYLAIFAVLMLIFNFLLYLKDKERYG
jgi:hypothetical protein